MAETRKFRVGPQGFYRQGEMHAPRSIIDLPADGKPQNQPAVEAGWMEIIAGQEFPVDAEEEKPLRKAYADERAKKDREMKERKRAEMQKAKAKAKADAEAATKE